MNQIDSTSFAAANVLTATPLAKDIFRIVIEHIGSTGWQIMRQANKPASEVKDVLARLVSVRIVNAEGNGLDAYYTPSGFGYMLKQQLRR